MTELLINVTDITSVIGVRPMYANPVLEQKRLRAIEILRTQTACGWILDHPMRRYDEVYATDETA